MNIQAECKVCLLQQTLNVLKNLDIDEETSRKVINELTEKIYKLKYDKSPPEHAIEIYGAISSLLNRDDLYKVQKANAIAQAESFVPLLKEKIKKSNNKLLTAIKISVAGNVLDLATQKSFDLNAELENIFKTDFTINNFKELKDDLDNAREIVILADNAGENIFDKILIETLNELYPNLKINYATRGQPIINDITYEEAKLSGVGEICNLVSSGVASAGFIYELASKEFREIYDRADFVIAKGMGNFETMIDVVSKKSYFLFKVKCNVVSKLIDREIGDIICLSNKIYKEI